MQVREKRRGGGLALKMQVGAPYVVSSGPGNMTSAVFGSNYWARSSCTRSSPPHTTHAHTQAFDRGKLKMAMPVREKRRGGGSCIGNGGRGAICCQQWPRQHDFCRFWVKLLSPLITHSVLTTLHNTCAHTGLRQGQAEDGYAGT